MKQSKTDNNMKSKSLFLVFLAFLTGCNTYHSLMKNTEATILYEFELVNLGDGDMEYFFKSATCIIGEGIFDLSKGVYTQMPEWYDLVECVPNRYILASELVDKLNKKYKSDCDKNKPSGTNFFSKQISEPGIHYSNYIYNYYLHEGMIYIIFRIKGDIALVTKISNEAILEYNKKYSCPILYNKLNLPFCKVVRLKDASPPSNAWLSRNGYYKMPIDNFRINFCD